MRTYIFIFLTITLIGCFSTPPEKTGKEGQKMPDFTILLTNNKTLNTKDIATGKPIVLFYFSPVCTYCNRQTNDILTEMDQFNDVQFYFISSYPLNQIEQFRNKFNLSKYQNVTIGVDTAYFIHDYYPANGVPFTAIYNKNKILNKAFLGRLSVREIAQGVDE